MAKLDAALAGLYRSQALVRLRRLRRGNCGWWVETRGRAARAPAWGAAGLAMGAGLKRTGPSLGLAKMPVSLQPDQTESDWIKPTPLARMRMKRGQGGQECPRSWVNQGYRGLKMR
jgi:hypothetical protein